MRENGIFKIPLGDNTDLCVGVLSCLFSTAADDGRDADGTADHRSGSGAAGDGTRDNTVVPIGPQVRDHRSTTTVRDHRSPRPSETVPAHAEKLECRVGAVKLHRRGYIGINSYDCDGAVYHYTARKDGSIFRAALKAYSGDLEITFVGVAN